MEFLFPAKGMIRHFLAECPIHFKGWIMRLTCLLIAMSCTGVQLLLAREGKGQDLTEVRITLELKNEPLRLALSKIEKQTDYRFAYNKKQVDSYKNITLAKDNYSLQQLLGLLLTNTQLSFRQVNNKIILFQAYKTEPDNPATGSETTAIAMQDDGRIRGRITNEKGEPVTAASVLLIGGGRGGAADSSGQFTITAIKPGKYKLQVSAIGFQTIVREVTVSGNNVLELNLVLISTNKALDEVIVTGYSKQNKRDVTGAASTVSADVIAQTPVTDITTALQGRVAGVSVDDQGGPGNAAIIRIRGIGSLGNNDPLYVIDGVQVRVGGSNGSQNIASLLNPSDIESVTILKDPSLTTLYGSEGSNGVIVITTKSGKRGDPKFEYSSYVGSQTPLKFPKMVTPQQQANALYQSYINSGQAFPYSSLYGSGTTPVLPDYIIEGPTPNVGVSANDPAASPSKYNFLNYRILKTNKAGTDWWKTLFKPAFTQNHQLAISGATDKSNYAITMGYFDDNGTLLNSYFKRLALRVNTDFKIKPWLRVGENVEFSYTTNNTLNTSNLANNQGNFNDDITNIWRLSPLLPTHDIAGNVTGTNGVSSILGGSNPLISRAASVNSKSYTESVIGSGYIEVEPVKNLTFQSKIGVQFVPNQYHAFSDSFPQEPIPSHTTYYYEGSSYYTDWRWLNKVAYSITINDVHKISGFVAYEARQLQSRGSQIVMTNLISNQPNFQYVSDGILNPNFPPTGSGDIQAGISEFGNVTYSFMDKYLFSGTLRHDGSSIFGVSSQYGTFPAASVGWRVSQEKFMENATWINDLKLRASWGKAGNDAIPPGQQFGLIRANDPIYGGYDLTGSNLSQILGAYASQNGNPSIHWETNVTTNLGFDAAFLHNRLTASFNWFNRKTKDLLFEPPFPGTAGAPSAPYQNIMSFTNKGIELELGFRSASHGRFSYDMNFNISAYKSNVDYIDGDSATFIDLATFAPTHYNLTRNMVGHPVSSFYGYVFDGIYQNVQDVVNSAKQPGISTSTSGGMTTTNGVGHFKFKDLTGPNGGKPDGQVGPEDQTFIGNPNPKFSYGYNLNLYYKNFDLGIFLQGVYGNKVFNYWRSFSEWPGALGAGSLDTWTPGNPHAKLPIYTQDGINGNNDNVPSSFFVESGSYLRLKSLQLGYTLPASKAFKRLRVYVQGFNLLTSTKYSGIDPEVNNGNPGALGIDFGTEYPNSKKILFGLSLGL
jgi:TonB-linked SusC/RagA family outer membrane protein